MKIKVSTAFILAVACLTSLRAEVGVWRDLGPQGGAVYKILIDPGPPVFYAGTQNGVFKSLDRGLNWTAASTGLLHPRVTDLLFLPGSSTLYASTLGGGVFRSEDGAVSWQALNQGLGNLDVRMLARRAPDSTPGPETAVNADTLYAATGNGVYVSVDGGQNWADSSNGIPPNSQIDGIALAPSAPLILYASMQTGIYRSSDGGSSWQLFNQGLNGSPSGPLAVDSSDANVVYAGTFSGVYKTVDGASWNGFGPGLLFGDVTSLTIHPFDNQRIFAGVSGGVVRTVDGGATWDFELGVGGIDNNLVTAVALDPNDPRDLYVGTLGGLYRGTESFDEWHELSRGLRAETARAVAVDPLNPQFLLLGAGNRIQKSADGGLQWNPASGLGGGIIRSLLIDPFNPRRIFATTSRGIFISQDGGRNWDGSISSGLRGSPQAMVIHPSQRDTLYAATSSVNRGVQKSSDGGQTWQSKGLSFIFTLAIDAQNPEVLYAGGLGVFKSEDGGESWIEVFPLPGGETGFSALAVNAAQPQTVYAGNRSGRVYRSTDGGNNWEVLGDRFNGQVTALVADPDDPQCVYAATFGEGVWIRRNDGAGWVSINQGLGNPFVVNLSLERSTGRRLYSSTFGGLFEMPLEDLPSPQIVASQEIEGNFFPLGEVRYRIRLENTLSSSIPDSAGDEFISTFPLGIKLLSAAADRGTLRWGPSSDTVSWNGSLEAGQTVAITLQARIEPGYEGRILGSQGWLAADLDGDGVREAFQTTDDPTTQDPGDSTVFTVGDPAVFAERLAVPHTLPIERTFVGVAVANVSAEEAVARVVGLDSAGGEVGEAQFETLGPQSQVAFLTTDAIDAAATLAADPNGELQSFFMLGDSSSSRLDGIGSQLLDSQLLFLADFHQTGDVESWIYFYNADFSEAAQVHLELFSGGGVLVDTADVVVPRFGSLIASGSELFRSVFLVNGFVRIESDRPVRAFGLVSDGDTFSTLPGQIPRVASRLWSPHFFTTAEGGTTRLHLLNPSQFPIALTVRATDDQLGLLGAEEFEVVAGNLKVVDLAELFSLQGQLRQGFLELEASWGEHGGFGLEAQLVAFLSYDGGILRTRSTLPLVPRATQLVRFLQVAQSAQFRIFQGLALLNPTATFSTVTVVAFDRDGNVARIAPVHLGPGSRFVGLLDNPFLFGEGFEQTGGYLEIVSQTPFVAYSLFGGPRFLSAIEGR